MKGAVVNRDLNIKEIHECQRYFFRCIHTFSSFSSFCYDGTRSLLGSTRSLTQCLAGNTILPTFSRLLFLVPLTTFFIRVTNLSQTLSEMCVCDCMQCIICIPVRGCPQCRTWVRRVRFVKPKELRGSILPAGLYTCPLTCMWFSHEIKSFVL